LIESPLVTIGIPTYNRLEMLRSAVESIAEQTYSNIELVISDNSSSDGTQDFLSSLEFEFPLKVLYQSQNIGMRENWNACLNEANGDYFLLLSDDDMLTVGSIQLLVDNSVGIQNFGFSYGRVQYLASNTDRPFKFKSPNLEKGSDWLSGHLKGERQEYPSATLIPTYLARDSGGYPNVGHSTDFAMLLLLASGRQVVYVDEDIALYRIHNTALSNEIGMIESVVSQLNWIASGCFVSDEVRRKLTKNYHWFIVKWIYRRRLVGRLLDSEAAYKQLLSLKPNLAVRILGSLRNNILFLGLFRILLKIRNLD
jgi:glycosyltransferase involved in cell wall biosynthesis